MTLHLRWLTGIGIAVLVLAGCINSSSEHAPAQESSNILTVITSPSINTYYESKNGPDGMAFQLIRKFADQYNYKLNIILTKNKDDIYPALDKGLADIALTGKPLSLSRQNSYLQSRSYMDVTSQLVYRDGSEIPKSFEDLVGKKILVQDNEQNREKYELFRGQYSDLQWEFSSLSSEELMGMVNTATIDYTIVDSHDFLGKRSLFTRTRVAFDLYYPEPISFALSSYTDAALRNSLDQFLDHAEKQGTIASLVERFYGHADDFNPRGSLSFFYHTNTRLPDYQLLIEKVASEFKLDWRLLAAIAYQESHWDPEATSPTGVRGMMMITNDTAMELGIENRLDPEESLRGGAKYFKNIYHRLPDSIKEPDRTWFALAAYNIGPGHILDARKITQFRDGNPDRWADVKMHLPLLEKKDWHEFTEFGYARGRESVIYVQNIRHLNSLLEWRFPLKTKEKKPVETSINVKNLNDGHPALSGINF